MSLSIHIFSYVVNINVNFFIFLTLFYHLTYESSCFFAPNPLCFSQIFPISKRNYGHFVCLLLIYMFLYVCNISNNLLIILLTFRLNICILSNVKILLTSQQINKHIYKEDVSWQSQMVLKWSITDALSSDKIRLQKSRAS